jgi:hypothetical protein
MHGTHSRYLKVYMRSWELVTPTRNGVGIGGARSILRFVSTLAWRNWGNNDFGIGKEQAPLSGLYSMDRNVNLYYIGTDASMFYVGIVLVGCRFNIWQN